MDIGLPVRGRQGSIEVAKLPDLVILSKDPTAVPPETLDQVKVAQTIKEGESIYRLERQNRLAASEQPQNNLKLG